MGNQTLLHLHPSPNGLSTWGSGATCSQPFSRPLNVWIQLVDLFKKNSQFKSVEVNPVWKIDIQIFFFYWSIEIFEEIHSTDIHITQHTGLTYTITRSPTPSLASDDVIHKFTLTGQITRKITHTIQHSDQFYRSKTKKILITTFH